MVQRGFMVSFIKQTVRAAMCLILVAAIAALASPGSAPQQKGAAGEVIQTKSGPVAVVRLATLDEPWGMAYLPDGRLLITEKPGRLRIFAKGKLSGPVAGVPKVSYHGQGGLLDVEIDPDFVRNQLVYLYFTEAAQKQPPDARDPGDARLGQAGPLEDKVLKGGAVARGRLDGETLRDVKVIWRQKPKMIGRGHFGGRLVFAPDGKLFITSGDRQRFEPAQDLTGNVGKIVRINPDGTIPDDNPFVKKQNALPDIWSLGHRNPLGAAINPESKKLWIHEMGPRHGDEINIPEPGKNYGWPVVSYGDHYNGAAIPRHPARPEFAGPIHYWRPAVSPSGFIFYTGQLFPQWRGNALIGGLSSETLLRLTLEGNRVVDEERIGVKRRIRDVIEAPEGSVLIVSDAKDGELLRLTPASPR